MVRIEDVRSSNTSFMSKPPGMVALFIGATSGIGLGTLKQFVKYARAPKVYIVGRSKTSAASLLDELKILNPQATIIFLETQISLIRNVDKICTEIKSNEQRMDLIVLSTGYLNLAGRQKTDEGIDIVVSLNYYGRIRTVSNLLPLLTASSSPRVVSILAGGREGPIDFTDLEIRNYSLVATAKVSPTMTLFAMEELASKYPSISFIHVGPGFVNTGAIDTILQTVPGLWAWPAWVARWTVVPVLNLFATTVEEAGERCLFLATSARYPPADPTGEGFMVLPPKGVDIAKSSNEKDGKGNGVYRIHIYGESAPDSPVLAGYRNEGAGKTVWEHTEAAWKRALERVP